MARTLEDVGEFEPFFAALAEDEKFEKYPHALDSEFNEMANAVRHYFSLLRDIEPDGNYGDELARFLILWNVAKADDEEVAA